MEAAGVQRRGHGATLLWVLRPFYSQSVSELMGVVLIAAGGSYAPYVKQFFFILGHLEPAHQEPGGVCMLNFLHFVLCFMVIW